MNKNFLFFILASSLLVLSVITICLAPIINGLGFFDDWNISNCQKDDDDYNYNKDHGVYTSNAPGEKLVKDKIKECKRHKVMHGLEFAALIADVALGFICTFLGLIHYVEQGKSFEKTSGLIGTASGGIATVLTVVYVVYSGIIFNNEPVRDREILYDNKALFHWDGNKYVYNYDVKQLEKDLDIPYIKIKDLWKKQYNYDSNILEMSLDTNSEYKNCKMNLRESDISNRNSILNKNSRDIYTFIIDGISFTKNCEYYWNSYEDIKSEDNKYLYDRWLATLIFSCIICVCGIGVAIFGFLLFTGNSSSS